MENIKQYLPWIIGAVVLIYVLRKLTTKTSFLPQTQLIQTPQTDPYAESRSKAFELLAGLGASQTQSDLEKMRISETSAINRLRIGAEKDVNLSAIEFQNRLANLQVMQRSQDIQLQQSAVDRYYSSRNNQAILGSINQALSTVFGSRTGNIFGTPKTFPQTSFDFGGFD